MTEGTPHPDAVLASLEASVPRRIVGVVALAGPGLALLALAGQQTLDRRGWQVVLALGACFAFFGAWRLWQATSVRLDLTGHELRDSGGRRIGLTADMRGVSRGTFAVKPSNGFVVTFADAGGLAWAPGLWWRIGRRVGVGGMTPAAPGRAMAERIAETIAARDGPVREAGKLL